MKQFLFSLFLALSVLVVTAMVFIFIANLTYLPPSLPPLLWYGFWPCFALTASFLYGCGSHRQGGAILLVAAIYGTAWYCAVKLTLPFCSTFTNLSICLLTAVFSLFGETAGTALKTHKKRQSKNAPPQNKEQQPLSTN